MEPHQNVKVSKVADVKLTYSPDYKYKDLPIINSSMDVFTYITHLHNWNNEEKVYCLLINRAGRLIGIIPYLPDPFLSISSIYKRVLLSNSSSIILATYKPGKKPGESDLKLAQMLKNTSSIFDLQLSDCIYFNMVGYYSLQDNDELF